MLILFLRWLRRGVNIDLPWPPKNTGPAVRKTDGDSGRETLSVPMPQWSLACGSQRCVTGLESRHDTCFTGMRDWAEMSLALIWPLLSMHACARACVRTNAWNIYTYCMCLTMTAGIYRFVHIHVFVHAMCVHLCEDESWVLAHHLLFGRVHHNPRTKYVHKHSNTTCIGHNYIPHITITTPTW